MTESDPQQVPSSLPSELQKQSLAEGGPSDPPAMELDTADGTSLPADEVDNGTDEDAHPFVPLTLEDKINKYKKYWVAFIGFLAQVVIVGQQLIDSHLLPTKVEGIVSIVVAFLISEGVKRARNIDPEPPVI